jgi:putative hydrolase of the HAD superfamily
LFQNISVIAFDLDDTLWPCMPTIERAEKATYQWLQQHYPRITERYSEQALLEFRKAFMKIDEKYQIDLSLMRRDMLAALAREFDYDAAQISQQGFELFIRLRHDVAFYDDVFPVLDQLKGRYRMGSISNGNASAGQTALKHYFDDYINAADVMVRKPGRELFHAFCERLEIEPQQCLYLGDDPEYDVIGARNAGLQSLWVNRDKQTWPQARMPAPIQISSLYELPDLLKE